MKLHENEIYFKRIVADINSRCDIREDILEKDYYVVCFLEELSILQQNGLQAYFKGGTALYKGLKSTKRFSEDIDLSVETRGCTRSQRVKRLDGSTKKYTTLKRNVAACVTNKSSVITVYSYNPIFDADYKDVLRRFGTVKIEATSFTISEPTEEIEITPIIYDYATEEEKAILEKQFGIKPFKIMAITIERIFIDKIFAAESYVRTSTKDDRAFEAAKHIYDLSVLENHPRIKVLLGDIKQMKRLLEIRMLEEVERLDGVHNVLPKDFILFNSVYENEDVKYAYENMLKCYVFNPNDVIKYEDACASLSRIKAELSKNIAWMEYSNNKIT